MKNSKRLPHPFVLTLLVFTLSVPMFGQVDISNSVVGVYYRGVSETVGSMDLTIYGDAFSGASVEVPLYMAFRFAHEEKLARTLVDMNSQDQTLNQPIYLAMFLADDHPSELAAPGNAISIVRWVKEESTIWLRIQSDSGSWITENGVSRAPGEDVRVSCVFGWDAQNVAELLASFTDQQKNLPYNTRNPNQNLDDGPEAAVSTLICLDLSTSTLTSSGPDGSIRYTPTVYESNAQVSPGVYSPATQRDIALGGIFPVGLGFDRNCNVAAIASPVKICAQAPGQTGLQTIANQLVLDISCVADANTRSSVLRSGSTLTLSINPAAGYGFGESSAGFNGDVSGVLELSEPFQVEGQTLYHRADLRWNGDQQILDDFLLETWVHLQISENAPATDMVLEWTLTLINAETETGAPPFNGPDQLVNCGASSYIAGFGLQHVATWGCGVANQRLIPHVTRADGGFTTSLIVANTGSEPESYSLSIYDESGVSGPSISGNLKPGRIQVYDPSAFSLPDGGYMSIFSSDSVSVTTVYQAVGENNGPAHLGESKEASPAWRLYPGNETITWDGAALVNLGASNAETVVVLKNVAGEILESVELEWALPGQKQLLFLTGLFTPREDGSYYEIRSNQPLALTALRGTWNGDFLWENNSQPVP